MSWNEILAGPAIALFAAFGSTWASQPCELAKLTASDAMPWDEFGCSVSLSGSVAVIGAPGRDCDDGPFCGAAFVYRLDGAGWIEEAKLTASDGAANDTFGASVAISGSFALIGAPRDNLEAGSAYVFEFNGANWVERAKLTPPDPVPHGSFGESVSIDSEISVIGAPGAQSGALPACGAVYVYRSAGENWLQEAKLIASDAATGDFFGKRVSIAGNVAVVGAPENSDADGTYVFRFDGFEWVQEARVPGGREVSNDTDTRVLADGCVYGFDGFQWFLEGCLNGRDGFPDLASLDGNTILTGDYLANDPVYEAGEASIYRFDGNDWYYAATVHASDAATMDQFGCSVSVSGDWGVIGAHLDDDGGSSCGSAYIFAVAGDCNDNGLVDLCDLAEGTCADCNANQVPDECDIAEGTSTDEDGNGNPDECEAPPGTGACCYPGAGVCGDSVAEADCQPPRIWHERALCVQVQCAMPESVPAASQWGMFVMSVALGLGIILSFGRRRISSS